MKLGRRKVKGQQNFGDYDLKKDGEIIYKLDQARILRALPPELRHRTYTEFANFMVEMIRYLVFNERSKQPIIRKFQKTIGRKSYSSEQVEDFRTYVDLFLKFWRMYDLLTLVGTEPRNPPSKDKEVVRKAIAEHYKRKKKKGT